LPALLVAAVISATLAAGATAAPAFADAISDCNDAAEPRVRIAGCSAVIEAEPADEVLAIALMNRGIAHVAAGDREQALADFNSALKASPDLATAHYNRGNIMLDLGRGKEAIADFSAVIDVAPDFALAWLNRGLAREHLGDVAGARRDLTQALSLDSSLDAARRGLVRLKRRR
jgi:tetratricopeptide (TPR) repeat protein